jgi:hypothetical protein
MKSHGAAQSFPREKTTPVTGRCGTLSTVYSGAAFGGWSWPFI